MKLAQYLSKLSYSQLSDLAQAGQGNGTICTLHEPLLNGKCLNILKGQAMVCPIIEQILKVHAMAVTIIIIKISPRFLLGVACTSGHHD